MSKNTRFLTLIATVASVMLPQIIAPTSAIAAEPSMNCQIQTNVVGTRQKMMKRDFSASIKLADAKLTPTTVGYGPGENLAAEITIIDGKYHIAKGGAHGKVVTSHTPQEGQGAVFLVTADARQWSKGNALSESFDISELDAQIGEFAKEAGCSGDVTFPFKIKGHASEIEWSVESKPEKKIGTFEDVDVEIVGIFSNHDKPVTFMVRGYSLHAHTHIPAHGVTGHIRDISLDEGAQLFVPKK